LKGFDIIEALSVCPELCGDVSIRSMHENLDNLQHINTLLMNCKVLTGITIFYENCGYFLYHKHSNNCLQIGASFAADSNIVITPFSVLFSLILELNSVYLSGCSVTDADLICLVNNSPKLEQLILRRCHNMFTHKSLTEILTKCRQLTDLQLFACCNQISLDNLLNVFKIPNTIQTLRLQSYFALDKNSITTIINSNPQLKTLSVVDVRTLTNNDRDEIQVQFKEREGFEFNSNLILID
jgi:hypothetical protein